MIKTYVKKRIPVQGVTWTGDNLDEMQEFCGSIVEDGVTTQTFQANAPHPYDPSLTAEVFDVLHCRSIPLRVGDTVFRGAHGELYPIAAAVLAETYDEAQPITTARDLIKAVEEYVQSLGWAIETNWRDADAEGTHAYDLYVTPPDDAEVQP